MLLKRLSRDRYDPWMCIGDFNKILYQYEKKGKQMRSTRQLQKFRKAIEFMGLHDLGCKGPFFTCFNGRKDRKGVWKKLDRAFVNEK